jgi:hypothetical protein
MAALATDFVQSGDSLRLLGHDDRVAMTARATHVPTTEALAIELDFLEHWFKR